MKHYIFLALSLLFVSMNAFAADSLRVDANTGSTKATWQATLPNKVPKQYSLEFGYRNAFYQAGYQYGQVNTAYKGVPIMDANGSAPNQATHGFGFLFDYAWQLSGLNGKRPPVYLSVPMGYTVLFADNASSKRISMLNYGWTTRHELNRNKKFTPFVGYGLLLNTLKIEGVKGGVMGHQTQFDLGVNMNTPTRLKLFAKLQLSYTSYPKLESAVKTHFMFADMRFGVRF